MTRWAALLRAVNVGGRKLAMAELTALASEIGLDAPRTLLASGNLVFGAEATAAELEDRLECAIATRFGLASEVLVRDRAALDAVIAANPFRDAAEARPAKLVVHFHREPVPADYPAALAADNPRSERIAAHGRELYVDYAEGIADSKLDRVMKLARHRRLNTARNWNTVVKLRDLLA